MQAIAKQCHAFFIAVQPSAMQSKWYGETNKHVAGVFKLARRLAQNSACVIFIGEHDTDITQIHSPCPLYMSYSVPFIFKDNDYCRFSPFP